MNEETKICNKCQLPRPVGEFKTYYKKRTNKPYESKVCVGCVRIAGRERAAADKIKRLNHKPIVDFSDPESVRQWNINNKNKLTYVDSIRERVYEPLKEN